MSLPSGFRRGEVVFGLVLLGLLLAAFLFWPLVSSVDPYKLDVINRLKPPSLAHPFGTDDFGRDVFSRVMHAGRPSLLVGLLVVLGRLHRRHDPRPRRRLLQEGGRAGLTLRRCADGLPRHPARHRSDGSFGPSLLNAVIALGLVYMPRIARVVRAATPVQRELPFVEAAISPGASRTRILRPYRAEPAGAALRAGHLRLRLCDADGGRASFFGAGVPPEMPTLGNMIAAGQPYFGRAEWMMLFPGVAIALAVLALQTLGDGLRDALDPILSRSR